MSGSQKHSEAEDRATGSSHTHHTPVDAGWNEEAVRRFLPEFFQADIQTPEPDILGALDTDMAWISDGPQLSETHDFPKPGSDFETATPQEFTADDAADRGLPPADSPAAVPVETDRTKGPLTPASPADEDPVQITADAAEDEAVANPETAAVSWEYVEVGPAVAAGSTQEVQCFRTENDRENRLNDDPEKTAAGENPVSPDAVEFAGTTTDLSEPVETEEDLPEATETAMPAPRGYLAEETGIDALTGAEPAEPAEEREVAPSTGPDRAGKEAKAVEKAGSPPVGSDTPPGPEADEKAVSPEPDGIGETSPIQSLEETPAEYPVAEHRIVEKDQPIELTDAQVITPEAPPVGVDGPAESADSDSAPLEMTQSEEGRPAAAQSNEEQAEEEDAPLELTDTVEIQEGTAPSATESIDGGQQPDADADLRAGLKALFAGAARATREKDYPTAIACLERFVDRSPNDPRGHYHLAVLHCRAKNYPEARRSAQKAAELGAAGTPKLLEKISAKLSSGRPGTAKKTPGVKQNVGGTQNVSRASALETPEKVLPAAVPQNDLQIGARQQPVGTPSAESGLQGEPPAPVVEPAASEDAEKSKVQGLPEFPTLDVNESEERPAAQPASGGKAESPADADGPGPSIPPQTSWNNGTPPDSAPAAAADNLQSPESQSQKEIPPDENESLKALFIRGMKANARKDYQAAVELFEKFVSRSPEPAKGYYNLAILHYRRHDYAAAQNYADLSVQSGMDAARKILVKIEKRKRAKEAETSEAPDAGQTNPFAAGGAEAETGKSAVANVGGAAPASSNPDRVSTPAANAATVQEPPTDATGHGSAAVANAESSAGRESEIGSAAAGPTAKQLNDLFARGIKASQRKDYPRAISLFEQFVAANPKEPKGHYNLAILHYRLQDYPAARRSAQKALDLGVSPAATILKKIDRKTAKIPAAAASQASPSSSASTGADRSLDAALAEPEDEESTEDLASRFLEQIQEPSATEGPDEPAAEAAATRPASARAEQEDRLASHIESQTGEMPGSAEESAAAPGANPVASPDLQPAAGNPTRPRPNDGHPSAGNTERVPAAKAATEDKTEGLFARGMQASKNKDYDTAIRCFKRFVSLKPREPRGHYNLAILLYRLEEFDEARRRAEKAIEFGLKSANQVLDSINAKQGRNSSAAPTPPSEIATAAEKNPPEPETGSLPDNGNMQLYDVQELDTEDFDTSAFLKNESVVWDADELEDAFEGGQPAAPVEENDYTFQEDIIVFDSPEPESASNPEKMTGSEAKAGPPAKNDASGGGRAAASAANHDAGAPATGEASSDDDETDRCFRLGKDAIGRKDYLQAVKQFTRVAELNPQDPRAFFQLAVISFRMKYFETSREHAERALSLGYKPAKQLLETIQERAQAS